MQEQIRFYIGTSFRVYPLKRDKTLIFGSNDDCDIRIPRFDSEDLSGQVVYTAEGWELNFHGRRSALTQGVFVVLHNGHRIALEFLHDNGTSQQVFLSDAEKWHLGRSAEADISLPNERVSSNHAELYQHNGEWRVCDLNSTNGTYVNGEKIQDVALCESDEIAIGPFSLVYSSGTLAVSGENARLKPRKHAAAKPRASGEFHRSPRLIRTVPDGEVEIDAAPDMGGKPEINWLTTLAPTAGSLLASVGLTAATGSAGMLMSAPMMLVGVATAAISYRSQTKKFDTNNAALRQKYQDYLDEKESRLREAARLQRDAARFYNPSPSQCLAMAVQRESRLFERTAQDADFLSLRVGLGEEKLRMRACAPKEGFALQKDKLSEAARKLTKSYETIENMPILCDLKRAPVLGIVGDRIQTQRVAQALLVQLCALHGNDEVRVAVVFSENNQEQWMWTRWLPQVWNEDHTRRYVACDRYEADEMFQSLGGELNRRASKVQSGSYYEEKVEELPHWVFLLTDLSVVSTRMVEMLTKQITGVSCIALAPRISALPAGVSQIVEANGEDSVLFERNAPEAKRGFTMDQISVADCDAFARALAPIRLRCAQAEGHLPQVISLLEGYRVTNPAEIEIGEAWTQACSWKSLSVPIGRGTQSVYYFDIHEKHGGPHGLVAGSNGSGKSEMAQSWIASMALQFSPRDVNFVLVDFKGTSLLAPLKNLPHLAGSISNLDRDAHRCLQALDYEIERRQRMVDHWNVRDILEYQEKSAKNPDMEPMPFLILVIDEFADFKARFPDFTGALEHIFRGGRSLGVYTLIMTQKPAGVVTEQMYANARFRWCLKVMSESDSREMLGVGSAARITMPGRCYIKLDTGEIDAVQPFYAGARYEPADEKKNDLPVAAKVLRNGQRQSATETNSSCAHGTQLEAVVQTIAEHCRLRRIPGARKLWLPPLEEKMELSTLLPKGEFWKSAEDWTDSASDLCAVIGKLDDPSRQEQRVLAHHFFKDGHLLVYGMPLSGKTTLLSTMVVSLCDTYAPDQVQIYLMEFGGYALRGLERFPHVCGAGGDDEPQVLSRIIHAFGEELKRRKQLFRSCGVGSYTAYREGENLPAWLLFIDNLSLCCGGFYELTEELIRVSREGEAFGLYLACTTTGTTGLNYTLSQNFATVMSLQLNDASEYTMLVGRAPAGMPRRCIGRGLVRGPKEFQTAVAFAQSGDRERAAFLRAMAEQMQKAWHGKLPVKITSIPQSIPYGSVHSEPITLGLKLEDGQTEYLPLSETVGIMVSAADSRSKAHARWLLQIQLCEQKDMSIITNVRDANGARFVEGARQWMEQMQNVASELRRRQSLRKSGSQEKFAQIVILIDDLTELLEGAEDELISRLEVFVRLGAGLNVTVIALDLARNLEKMYFGGDILMETMREQVMLLVGGDAQEHRVAEGKFSCSEAKGTLENGDWIVVTNEGFCAVRPIESEE